MNGSPYPVSSLPSPYYVIRVELDRTIRLPGFTDATGLVTNPVDNIMTVSSPDPAAYIKTTCCFDDVVQGGFSFRTNESFQTGTRANAHAISGLWGPEMEFAGPESFLTPGAVPDFPIALSH